MYVHFYMILYGKLEDITSSLTCRRGMFILTVLLVPAHCMQKHTAVVEQELVPGALHCPLQQGQQGVAVHDPDREDQSHQTA